jgi:ABC-2 type transport system permease protein
MTAQRVAAATARMEIAALARRPGTAAAIAVLAAFPLLTYHHLFTGTAAQVVARQAYYLNTFAPVAVGVSFADRFVRERTLGVAEVLEALPVSATARLLGRFAGLVVAAAMPMLVVWAVAAARIAGVTHQATVFGLAAAAFAAGVLPGLVTVCGLCLAGPQVTGLPLFRVLFVCYWFWGNLIPGQLFPSPSGTWMTPIGGIALTGLFHADLGYGQVRAVDAAASICILLASGATLLCALQYLDTRRRTAA